MHAPYSSGSLYQQEEDGESKNDKRLDPLFFRDNGINDPEHQRLWPAVESIFQIFLRPVMACRAT